MNNYNYLHFTDIVKQTQYPSGETHLTVIQLPETDDVVEAHVKNFNDLCDVVTAHRVFDRQGIYVKWFIPSFPFARDDRRNSSRDGFELGLALDLIEREGLDVVIADPHSDVAGQLPHIPQSSVVQALIAETPDKELRVVVPDAGATKKALTWATLLTDKPMVQCLKHRDPTTGKLSGFQVLADDLQGAPCVIVDDICDGGGTFIGLAKELKEKNAGSLTLVVTHGLFTQGTDNLLKHFDRIISFSPKGNNADYYSKFILVSYQDLYEAGKRDIR